MTGRLLSCWTAMSCEKECKAATAAKQGDVGDSHGVRPRNEANFQITCILCAIYYIIPVVIQ